MDRVPTACEQPNTFIFRLVFVIYIVDFTKYFCRSYDPIVICCINIWKEKIIRLPSSYKGKFCITNTVLFLFFSSDFHKVCLSDQPIIKWFFFFYFYYFIFCHHHSRKDHIQHCELPLACIFFKSIFFLTFQYDTLLADGWIRYLAFYPKTVIFDIVTHFAPSFRIWFLFLLL